MSNFKYHNGIDFVDADIYVFNNNDFVKTEMYSNSNNDWDRIDYSPSLRTKTWTATWSQSYLGSNVKRDASVCYQGQGQGATSRGSHRSLIGFNMQDMMNELKDSIIQKVEFEFFSNHSWYSNGCKFRIGFHNHTNKPEKFSISEPNKKEIKCTRDTKVKLDLTNTKLGEKLRDGSVKGLALYVGNSTNLLYYGYINGATMSNPPKITISYIK